MVSSVEYIS